MKKLKFLVCLSGLFLVTQSLQIASAQIQVSGSSGRGGGKIAKENFEKFKKSTTYFVLQEKDYEQLDQYKAAIAKVWTVTPFEIIKPEEMRTKPKKNSSFFFFGGDVTVRQGKSTTSYHTHLSYDLYMMEANKKGKMEQLFFGKFMLHPDSDTYIKSMKYATSSQNLTDKLIPYLYSDAVMTNWNPLFLAGYLKVINDDLVKGTARSIFDAVEDNPSIKNLKNETLYVPTYVNIKTNMFTMKQSDEEEDEADLKNAYPYSVQYIDAAELSKKAASGEAKGYYISYIRSSTDKFVSIFDIKTNELIYTVYTPVSYNFKLKDLKRFVSKIK